MPARARWRGALPGWWLRARLPLARLPLARLPLARLPLARLPLARLPLARLPLARLPLAWLPLAWLPLAWLLLALAAAAPAGAAASEAPPARATAPDVAPALAGTALRDALLRGGYVLYFRHTSTDFSQQDDNLSDLEDCRRQRNLTDRGRDEARAIGAAITALQLPIGDVLASPYCRTLETARLIFGRATPTPAARGGPVQSDPARYASLRQLLSTPPPPGRVRAIVSHGNPYQALVGPPYLAEGEAAVIEPLGGGQFRVVARIPRDGWGALSGRR